MNTPVCCQHAQGHKKPDPEKPPWSLQAQPECWAWAMLQLRGNFSSPTNWICALGKVALPSLLGVGL